MSGNSFVNRLDLAIEGNAGRLRPTHIALYTVILRHFERNGYPDALELQGAELRKMVGINDKRTLRKTLDELKEMGLITVEYPQNQYSSYVVGLPVQKMYQHDEVPVQKMYQHDEGENSSNANDSKQSSGLDDISTNEVPIQKMHQQSDIYILYNNNIDSNKEYNKEINNIINNKHICQIFEKNEPETKNAKPKKEKSCAKKENDDGSFERFWGMYPVERHSNMKYCRDYWYNKLNEKERQAIIERLPAYIASVSETKYLKLTEFFFKNQKFRDEAFMHAGANGKGNNGSGGNGRLTEVKDLRTSTDYSEAIAKMNYCQRNNIPQSEWKNIDWSKINLNKYKS